MAHQNPIIAGTLPGHKSQTQTRHNPETATSTAAPGYKLQPQLCPRPADLSQAYLSTPKHNQTAPGPKLSNQQTQSQTQTLKSSVLGPDFIQKKLNDFENMSLRSMKEEEIALGKCLKIRQ